MERTCCHLFCPVLGPFRSPAVPRTLGWGWGAGAASQSRPGGVWEPPAAPHLPEPAGRARTLRGHGEDGAGERSGRGDRPSLRGEEGAARSSRASRLLPRFSPLCPAGLRLARGAGMALRPLPGKTRGAQPPRGFTFYSNCGLPGPVTCNSGEISPN